MKRSRPSSLALAILSLVLPACDRAPREPSLSPAPAPASDPAVPPVPADGEAPGAAPSEGIETPQDAAPSGEDTPVPEPPPLTPLGVPECDKFIDRYVACVDLRVPADNKDRLMREIHVHRARWRELQRMENGKLAAGLSCRGVAQRLKGDLTVDYGCEF